MFSKFPLIAAVLLGSLALGGCGDAEEQDVIDDTDVPENEGEELGFDTAIDDAGGVEPQDLEVDTEVERELGIDETQTEENAAESQGPQAAEPGQRTEQQPEEP